MRRCAPRQTPIGVQPPPLGRAVEHGRVRPRKLDLVCSACGYVIVRARPPERCPMCQSLAGGTTLHGGRSATDGERRLGGRSERKRAKHPGSRAEGGGGDEAGDPLAEHRCVEVPIHQPDDLGLDELQ